MAADPSTAPQELEAHFRVVARRLHAGRVIPFLGAGANLCGRPPDADWFNQRYLPSGSELTAYLAQIYGYPSSEPQDLLRVSQYVQATTGGTTLYDELHELFAGDYRPNALHEFLATVSRDLRLSLEAGKATRQLLSVTTNYDDALEQAFEAAGEPFDLVSYVAKGPNRGKFIHHRPDGGTQLIEEPNRYRELSLDKRAVILKVHGAVDREAPDDDSYVITEDHYIEYLAQTDISNIIPAALMAAMNESHFLFLGYSLKDWNLRVILHRIWGQQPFEEQFTSWAIQKNPSKLEEHLWGKRNVLIQDFDLEDYVGALRTLCVEPPDGTASA